ncbi:hypothetical protein J6590_010610 [Homalodisca vitripennis]|nr:hypothetical protein J6590_010610 [Homalodisca vitripennis]
MLVTLSTVNYNSNRSSLTLCGNSSPATPLCQKCCDSNPLSHYVVTLHRPLHSVRSAAIVVGTTSNTLVTLSTVNYNSNRCSLTLCGNSSPATPLCQKCCDISRYNIEHVGYIANCQL